MRAIDAATVILTCSLAVAVAGQADPRARLDEVQRLSSQRNYAAAISAFETIKAQQPDAIGSLDGLKMVTVYAETGDMTKFVDLTRWMVQRWQTPKTSTEAERQVKGYIVHKSAKDPQLIARGVEWTDILITRMVMKETEDVFASARD